MAFGIYHSTAADGTFSAAGTTAWDAALVLQDATSGGLLYASSSTAVGCSALLAANSLVLGGGAGVAPFTDAVTYNPTTDILATNGPMHILGALGATLGYGFSNDTNTCWGWRQADTLSAYCGNNEEMRVDNNGVYALSGNFHVGASVFAMASAAAGSIDTGLSRVSAGVVGVGTGAAGSIAGTISAAAYVVGGSAGADFGPGMPTSITVVKGIITAIS